MVHLTLAISDFMIMLISAALWTGGGFLLIAVAGLGAIGGLAALAWRFWR